MSEATFATLLHRTSEGLIVRDRFGKITYANPASAALLERSESHLMGSRLTDLGIEWLYEDGAPVLRPTPCLSGNSLELGHECETHLGLRRESGLVRWLRLVVHPFEDEDETKTMMLLSDVTNDRLRHAEALALKRQLEQELDARTTALQRALGDAKTLATAIANDLRVPLTQVDGHLGILSEYLQEAPEAHRSMRRLQELVRDLRDFASTTHDLALMHEDGGNRVPVSLSLLCTNAAKDFLVGRDVSIDFAALGPSKVACDPLAIRGAVTCLLSLAHDCRRPNGRVVMSTTETAYSTTLHVSVESDPDRAARVLTSSLDSRSHRLHDDVAGVRILLVNRVAELHDGAFWATTGKECTEFLMSLPSADVALAA